MGTFCEQQFRAQERIRYAIKTTRAVDLKLAVRTDINLLTQHADRTVYIYCTLCGWFDRGNSIKDLEYFVLFNLPAVCLFLCVGCCSRVYERVERVQAQRVECLFNNPDYWGIFCYNTAERLKSWFLSANKCGSFIWEVQSVFPFDPERRELLVAVTHVKYSISSDISTDFEYRGLGECTFFIQFFEGRYIVCRRLGKSVQFLPEFEFATLKEAIDRARNYRLAIDCFPPTPRLFYSEYCTCCQINRSSVINIDTLKVVNRVWSLQNICAFFIRNYSFHYQRELAKSNILPNVVRSMIRDVRSVVMCTGKH
jgi:hypothetical protein